MFNENNEEVFPYQVNTIMPILGLSVGNIMVPSTVKLTKEDVRMCLPKAPVFRRFSNGKLERVSISSVDRLHNEKFMTEKEYEEFLDKQNDNRGKVYETAPVVEEKEEKEPEPEVEVKESVVEEEVAVEESTTVEAETVEEAAQTEEVVEESTEENVNDEEISEEVTEDSPEEVVEERNNRNNRYNNKKKHNR